MKKYKWIQEIAIMKEDATPLKEISVYLTTTANGIDEHKVLNMFDKFSDEITELMRDNNSQIEKGFAALNEKLMNETEKNGKGWFG